MPSNIESYLAGVYEASLALNKTKDVEQFIEKYIFTPKLLPIINKYKAQISKICAKYPKVVVAPKFYTNPSDAIDYYNSYIVRVMFLDYNYDYDYDETTESGSQWNDAVDEINDVLDEIADNFIADAKKVGIGLTDHSEGAIDDRAYLMEFGITDNTIKNVARAEGYDLTMASSYRIKPMARYKYKNKYYRNHFDAMEGVGLTLAAGFGAIIAAAWTVDKVENMAFTHKMKKSINSDEHPFHTMIVTPKEKEEIFNMTANVKNKRANGTKRLNYIKAIGYQSTYGGYHKLMFG